MLLLQIRNYIQDVNSIQNKASVQFFGQEINNQTFNLARMNMMLHQVPRSNQHLHNGDTLDADWPTDEPTNFDAVTMNPPYSIPWSAKEGFLTDPRFAPYKKLPPAGKADLAFLLHGYYHLKDTGTMGIVLPHGVLFRGAAEGTIREELLKKGAIYAVIGLPAGIFSSTGIPTCVVILKKTNTERSVLFIDGSKDFRKERAKNELGEEHIDKIFNAYKERKDVEKYAHLASFDEIEQNGFNLNIPRYVDNSEEEEEIDISATLASLEALEKLEAEVEEKLSGFYKELGLEFGKTEDGGRCTSCKIRPLKQIAVKSKEKNNKLEITNVLTNSAEFGIVSQKEYFERDIAQKRSIGNYYIVHNGDFVYNPRISSLAPAGPINISRNEIGIVSPLYTVFRITSNDVLPEYLDLFFESGKWIPYAESVANYGARFDRMNISSEDFFNMPIPLPAMDEQRKIIRFFELLEEKICLSNKILRSLKELKRALLSEMIP